MLEIRVERLSPSQLARQHRIEHAAYPVLPPGAVPHRSAPRPSEMQGSPSCSEIPATWCSGGYMYPNSMHISLSP